MNRILGIAILLAILTVEAVGLLQWIAPVERADDDEPRSAVASLLFGRS